MRTLQLFAAALLAGVPAVTMAAAPAAPLTLQGAGVQIYRCTRQAQGFAWSFQGPRSVLSDTRGRKLATNFAGPSWRGADGSEILGATAASQPSPEAGAVPWLAVRVVRHTGQGLLAGVWLVVRSDTHGGDAPTSGCDAERLGRTVEVPYRAAYTFFGAGTPPSG